MFKQKFGIEVEFTGVTRKEAATAAATILGGTVRADGYNFLVTTSDGRVWRFVYDASISPLRKQGKRRITESNDYKVEMVSPILTYHEDINTMRALIRKMRSIGGFTPDDAGIHVHLDGAPHTPRSICNFVKIISSKNDLLYKALQIKAERMRWHER